MEKRRRLAVLFALVLSFAIVPGVHSSVHADELDDSIAKLEDSHHLPGGVGFADIKGWKALGVRWAGALDANGRMIAIYDLSFPDLMAKFPLGSIGGRKITKKTIRSLIELAKLEPGVDKKKADKALKELEKVNEGPLADGALPRLWWQALPWVNNNMKSDVAPVSFTLAEIDWDKLAKDSKKFRKAIAEAEKALREIDDGDFSVDLLKQFELTKGEDDSYYVVWNPKVNAGGVSKPRKLADLVNNKWAFMQAAKLELVKQALDQAVGLVPMPLARAVIKTAMGRFFHFHDLVMRTQENMVVEMLNSAQDGTGIFSNVKLTVEERHRAIQALVYARTSLEDNYKWVWTNPDKEWDHGVKKQVEYTSQGEKWLEQHSQPYLELNSRFAFVTDNAKNEKKALVLLADRKSSKKNGPLAAIDYSKPGAVRLKRIRIEIAAPRCRLAFISWVSHSPEM